MECNFGTHGSVSPDISIEHEESPEEIGQLAIEFICSVRTLCDSIADQLNWCAVNWVEALERPDVKGVILNVNYLLCLLS